MKSFAKVSRRNTLFIATITCLIFAGSVWAFGVPPTQVAVTTNVQSVTANCCVLINPMVRLMEPKTVTPVIVTWSADYNVSGTAEVALSVNGAPCNAGFGPFVLQEPVLIAGSDSITTSQTRQWVVPTAALVTGTNTFQVCVGGFSKSQTVNIGFSTLTVQIGK